MKYYDRKNNKNKKKQKKNNQHSKNCTSKKHIKVLKGRKTVKLSQTSQQTLKY